MVHGGTVIEGGRKHVKISVVDACWILVQKHVSVRRSQPHSDIRIFIKRFEPLINLRIGTIKMRVGSHVIIHRAGPDVLVVKKGGT